MITAITAFLVISCTSGVSGQLLSCPWVATLDCSLYSPALECGTDGVTYENRCYFSKQQCKDHSLHILHSGACTAAESSTTPVPQLSTTQAPRPTTTANGHDAVLDFFCTSLSHRDCGTEVQEVCGTDNWTYLNYCEYDKARCTHRNLKVKNFGPCV